MVYRVWQKYSIHGFEDNFLESKLSKDRSWVGVVGSFECAINKSRVSQVQVIKYLI